jgi:hypothetical protein
MSAPSDLETQLRQLLNARADALQPSIDTGDELRKLKARFPRERRRSAATLVAAAAVGVAIVGGLATGVVALTSMGGRDMSAAPAPPLPPPAPTMTPVALPGGSFAERELNGFVTPSPDLVINGVLWVDDLHDGRVVRMDPATLHVLSSTNYEMQSGLLPGVLTQAGNVVLLPVSGPALFGPTVIRRFDARTGQELSGIVVTAAGAITVTPLGVFATVAPNTVGLLDAAGGRVVRTFAMPVDRSLAYADGLMWGWDLRRSLLVGVDPARGTRVREFALPGYSDRPLTALDSETLLINAPSGTAELDVATGQAPAYTHADALSYARDSTGALWGVVDGLALVELDRVTLRTLRSYSLKDLDRVLVAGNRLIAADHVRGVVESFDLARLRGGK